MQTIASCSQEVSSKIWTFDRKSYPRVEFILRRALSETCVSELVTCHSRFTTLAVDVHHTKTGLSTVDWLKILLQDNATRNEWNPLEVAYLAFYFLHSQSFMSLVQCSTGTFITMHGEQTTILVNLLPKMLHIKVVVHQNVFWYDKWQSPAFSWQGSNVHYSGCFLMQLYFWPASFYPWLSVLFSTASRCTSVSSQIDYPDYCSLVGTVLLEIPTEEMVPSKYQGLFNENAWQWCTIPQTLTWPLTLTLDLEHYLYDGKN